MLMMARWLSWTRARATSVVPMPRISGLASASSQTARLAVSAAAHQIVRSGRADRLEHVPEGVDRGGRGHLAGCGAPHAVGDRVERIGHEQPVLVVAPDQADVGIGAGPQLDHLRTSIVVRPNWTWSPLRMTTGAVTFFLLR